MADFKQKIGSWVVAIFESTFFGFVSRIKENMIELLEELPENSTRAFYGLCLLLFVVIIGAAGAVIFSASLIIIIVQNSGPDVNKVLYAGQAFAFLGFFFMVVALMLVLMVGKNVKISTEKATRKLVRKLGK